MKEKPTPYGARLYKKQRRMNKQSAIYLKVSHSEAVRRAIEAFHKQVFSH